MRVLTYDHTVSQDKPGPGRSSEVLDAILGTIADNRSRTETTNTLFRAKALDQLDIAADIDNQLPLVSRRNWLLLLGAGLIVIAFVVWAALTPATQTVNASGRVIAPSGLLSVTSPVEGFMQEMLAESGSPITVGETVAVIDAEGAQVPVKSVVEGLVWQVPNTKGSPVGAGEVVVTVLPTDSDRTALIVVPSNVADSIRPGMAVSDFGQTVGVVALVNPPLLANEVMLRTGVSVEPNTFASIVQVDLNQPARPGTESTYTIQLTSQTVLEQMFSR